MASKRALEEEVDVASVAFVADVAVVGVGVGDDEAGLVFIEDKIEERDLCVASLNLQEIWYLIRENFNQTCVVHKSCQCTSISIKQIQFKLALSLITVIP